MMMTKEKERGMFSAAEERRTGKQAWFE